MLCLFTFKHMKSSDALSEYAESKVCQKIEKFSTKPIEAMITFSVEGLSHIAHCGVKGGDGFNFQVEASSEDMYSSVDLLVDKLAIQLKKQKEKLKNHKHSVNIRQLPQVEYVSKDDCDSLPVDASDVIKFDKAKKVRNSG